MYKYRGGLPEEGTPGKSWLLVKHGLHPGKILNALGLGKAKEWSFGG